MAQAGRVVYQGLGVSGIDKIEDRGQGRHLGPRPALKIPTVLFLGEPGVGGRVKLCAFLAQQRADELPAQSALRGLAEGDEKPPGQPTEFLKR
jgi:hypothetical protein